MQERLKQKTTGKTSDGLAFPIAVQIERDLTEEGCINLILWVSNQHLKYFHFHKTKGKEAHTHILFYTRLVKFHYEIGFPSK